MCEKMPYLKEDEIVINGKKATTATSNSSVSDVDDAEESLFENKVGNMGKKNSLNANITTTNNNNNNEENE